MTAAAKRVVEEFEHLSDSEKREVLAGILRTSGRLDYPEVSDEELIAAADAIFLDFDQRESSE